MTCPSSPDPEPCTDMTACPSCPRATDAADWCYSRARGWHAPGEFSDECLSQKPCSGCVAHQDREWGVRSSGGSYDGAEGASTPPAPEERPSDSTGKAAPCG